MYNNQFIESKLIPFCALLFGLGIAVSTALMTASYILMVVLVVFTRLKGTNLKDALRYKYIQASLLFFALIIIGCIWSNVSYSEQFKMITRLIEYALIPLILIGLQTNRSSTYLIKAFVAGAVFSAILSILAYLFKYPIFQGRTDTIYYWTVFRGHLLHDVFLAIASNFILWAIFDTSSNSNKVKLWLILAYLICFIDAMFLVQGRTGQVMMIAMNIMIVLFRFRVKGLVYTLISLAVIIPMLLMFAPAVKDGINAYKNDQVQLQKGNSETSTGLRRQFRKNSIILIKQSPIIGFGTGAFTGNYAKIVKGTDEIATNNPHCDWLLIAVQWGVFGVLIFAGVVLANAREFIRLDLKNKAMGVSLLVGYLIATSQNSFFMDNVTGFAYMFLSLSLIARAIITLDNN